MRHFGLLLILCAMFVSSHAKAVGFYFEPAITYEKGDNKLEWPAPLGDSTGNTRGLGVDLKFGVHFESSLFAGLDLAYSKPRFEQSVTDYAADATSTLYGVVVGAQMPVVGFRLWLGYVLGGDLDPDQSGGIDLKFEGAHGPKVGVGFRILMLSLNLEYMDLEYNDSILEKSGSVTGSLDNKLKNKLGLVSISMPLIL